MTESGKLHETESFIAFRDEWGAMSIRPVHISGFWEHILEDDWYFMFEERPELGSLFKRITKQFKKAVRKHKADVLKVEVEVEYSLIQPPGVKALQWGHHLGTADDYMFKATPKGDELRFITGFVRTISMEPL